MYKTICVAVDGSDSSLEAVHSAAKLAKRFDAGLALVHVIRPMKIPQELQRYMHADDLASIRHSALENVGQEIVASAESAVADYQLSSVRTAVLSGDPAQQILKAARRQGADLIVMGTRGLGKLEGALIGSISRRVVEMSDVNVMIIKQAASDCQA